MLLGNHLIFIFFNISFLKTKPPGQVGRAKGNQQRAGGPQKGAHGAGRGPTEVPPLSERHILPLRHGQGRHHRHGGQWSPQCLRQLARQLQCEPQQERQRGQPVARGASQPRGLGGAGRGRESDGSGGRWGRGWRGQRRPSQGYHLEEAAELHHWRHDEVSLLLCCCWYLCDNKKLFLLLCSPLRRKLHMVPSIPILF